MFYFDVNAAQTTNAGAGTENQSARFLTVANQRTCKITELYVAGRHTAAGSLLLRLKTMATPGTVGSAYTPGERDSDGPAAATTVFTAHTVGVTPTVRQIVGCSGQGGFGGWIAGDDEQALTLKPNGGATGNAEITNLGGVASILFDLNVLFGE